MMDMGSVRGRVARVKVKERVDDKQAINVLISRRVARTGVDSKGGGIGYASDPRSAGPPREAKDGL